jgi:hypothetical protein
VLLRKLKREKLELWAVGVIYKFHQGWKVRKEYRSKFRSIAGPKIVKFFRLVIVSIAGPHIVKFLRVAIVSIAGPHIVKFLKSSSR